MSRPDEVRRLAWDLPAPGDLWDHLGDEEGEDDAEQTQS